MIKDIFLNDII